MTKTNPNSNNHSSLWQKIKNFLHFVGIHNHNEESEGDEGSTGTTTGKLRGQGFKDPKTAKLGAEQLEQTFVKEPETVLYNELKKDPAAMQALKTLTNGQIPVSEAAAAFERIRSSEVALEAIINSEFAPPDVKARAREEKAQIDRKKLAAQEGFKKPPPKPGF